MGGEQPKNKTSHVLLLSKLNRLRDDVQTFSLKNLLYVLEAKYHGDLVSTGVQFPTRPSFSLYILLYNGLNLYKCVLFLLIINDC